MAAIFASAVGLGSAEAAYIECVISTKPGNGSRKLGKSAAESIMPAHVESGLPCFRKAGDSRAHGKRSWKALMSARVKFRMPS